MDIHQIMQTIGQILYMIFTRFAHWIEELSAVIGVWISGISLPASPTVIKIFSDTSVNRIVFFVVLGYILLVNIWAFSLYGIDKKHARQRKMRVSEKALMRMCIIGGAGGGLIGMAFFRHKTKHKKFKVGVPVLFAVQLIFYSFALGFLGFWAFF